jgi:hypothetical protein
VRDFVPGEGDTTSTDAYHYPIRDLGTAEAMKNVRRTVLLSEGDQAYWYAGSMALALGGGGIGKSRWVVGLAMASITGREFCGFRTANVGKWLILNAENDEFRTRDDLFAFAAGYQLTPEERDLVRENLKIVSSGIDEPLPPTDLADPHVALGLSRLARMHKPAVVVIDPWESFISNSDVNDAAATRRSLQQVQALFPQSTVLVLHHSREGAEAAKSAFGFNASAFSKGSKSAMTRARFVINITPRTTNLDTDAEHGLVISCGKSNDTRKFSLRCVILDDSGVYRVDPSFDVNEYLKDLDGPPHQAALSVGDVVAAVHEGITTGAELVAHFVETAEISRATVHRVLAQAVKQGRLTRQRKGTRDHYRLVEGASAAGGAAADEDTGGAEE